MPGQQRIPNLAPIPLQFQVVILEEQPECLVVKLAILQYERVGPADQLLNIPEVFQNSLHIASLRINSPFVPGVYPGGIAERHKKWSGTQEKIKSCVLCVQAQDRLLNLWHALPASCLLWRRYRRPSQCQYTAGRFSGTPRAPCPNP